MKCEDNSLSSQIIIVLMIKVIVRDEVLRKAASEGIDEFVSLLENNKETVGDELNR